MNSKLWGSVSAAMCLFALSMPSHAETRTEWGTAVKGVTPVDDSALMEVSGRGSIDENAVKALQNNGKLTEYVASAGGQVQALLGNAAADSADKAAQTQLKMAMNSAQMVGTTAQMAIVVTPTVAPVPFTPVMTAPLFGLPMLSSKLSTDK